MPLRFLPILFLTCLYLEGRSQFIIGWNAGYATPRELNREIYVYNQINGSGLKKEMNPINWCQGPSVGIRVADRVLMEILFSRKTATVHSEFDSAGVPMQRKLKVISNTWNFGFGYAGEKWLCGLSLDLGRFKGRGKRGPESEIRQLDWQKLWVLSKSRGLLFDLDRLYCTGTIFVERRFSFIGIRAYAQLPLRRVAMDGLDVWMFGGDLNWSLSQRETLTNYGIMVCLLIGRK